METPIMLRLRRWNSRQSLQRTDLLLGHFISFLLADLSQMLNV